MTSTWRPITTGRALRYFGKIRRQLFDHIDVPNLNRRRGPAKARIGAISGDRFIDPADHFQHGTNAEVQLGLRRRLAQHLAIGRDGLLEPAEPTENGCLEVDMAESDRRPGKQPFDHLKRFAVASATIETRAKLGCAGVKPGSNSIAWRRNVSASPWGRCAMRVRPSLRSQRHLRAITKFGAQPPLGNVEPIFRQRRTTGKKELIGEGKGGRGPRVGVLASQVSSKRKSRATRLRFGRPSGRGVSAKS